eukprot:453486-Amphidinium_carterae.2
MYGLRSAPQDWEDASDHSGNELPLEASLDLSIHVDDCGGRPKGQRSMPPVMDVHLIPDVIHEDHADACGAMLVYEDDLLMGTASRDI